jgi:hypothetical protein
LDQVFDVLPVLPHIDEIVKQAYDLTEVISSINVSDFILYWWGGKNPLLQNKGLSTYLLPCAC